MGSTTPSEEETLPYWQINVPPSLRTPICPPFLLNINTKDYGIISTPDSLYQIESWPTVQSKIAQNRLDLFQRKPSDLRRYLEFTYNLKQEWGSVMNFILSQRLKWELPIVPQGNPFESKYEKEDIRILRNDWPYGIDERIVHLVVWTKFELVDDERTGDLTDEARREIDEWVGKKFGERVGRDNVIWFKNWASLKSVKSVEHFHIMLFDPDPKFVEEVTNGDVPLCETS
ncbi:hypothetical protein QBC38DRAFT_28917 [Podospora fimiseda]|uniref:N-acetylglucosamine-induced protein 1 n=1 Tax=Podospora fimiseda TaxID=252190 RepID=A0AAN7BWA2_9PEZI|nr:hypothetical protein QBC38DRAFT_28917 [Podospora fimiseda]